MAGGLAGLLDRLASHSQAGCSRQAGNNTLSNGRHLRGTGLSRSPRGARAPPVDARWSDGCQTLRCSERRRQRGRKGGTRGSGLACHCLQQIDYSFYAELPAEQITDEFLWGRLEPLLGYLTPDQRQKVQEALFLAYDSHSGQRRKSGEPYITHPVEVTRILAELKMDAESLMAGLLHDTVEDTTAVTFDEIEQWFGRAVRRIVEGETRFSKLSRLQAASCGVWSDAEDDSASASEEEAEEASDEDSWGEPSAGADDADGGWGDSSRQRSAEAGQGARLHSAVRVELGSSARQERGASSSNGSGGNGSHGTEGTTATNGSSALHYAGEHANGNGAAPATGGNGAAQSSNGATLQSDIVRQNGSSAVAAGSSTVAAGSSTVAAGSSNDVKATDLRQLFVAMTEEVRIVVVKLADRLHNMRTLDSMPPAKQKKIADETLQVFAPLARLLGLYSIKEELEELAMRYAHPRDHADISARLAQLAAEEGPVLEEARSALESLLQRDSYLAGRVADVQVTVHQQAAYSLFRKMSEGGKKVVADDIRDVAQLRVILHPAPGVTPDSQLFGTDSQLCYHVLGLVHTMWAPIPGGMKDYIATPKSNGYQSLHSRCLPLGASRLVPVEVQIRTAAMHRLALYGIAGENWTATGSSAMNLNLPPSDQAVAASAVPPNRPLTSGAWRAINKAAAAVTGNPRLSGARVPAANGYEPKANGKEVTQAARVGGAKLDQRIMERRVNWLQSIRNWQAEFVGSLSDREFVDCITGDLLGRGVFVFTPSGQVMRLPKGATVVDFAYHVHTDVGNQMVAARVNSKVVEAAHVLANAEVVEVITYNGPPTPDSVARHAAWVDYAQTRSARHKLAKFLRDNAALLPPRAPPPAGSASVPGAGGSEGGYGSVASPAVASAGEPLSSSSPTSSTAKAAAAVAARDRDGAAKASPVEALEQKDAAGVWLTVRCGDRPGLLADIAAIIHRHGLNIQAYSGRPGDEPGAFDMSYQVAGDASRLSATCAAIAATPAVISWAAGCSLHPE